MGIFPKYLWLIPDILKHQDYKIFIQLVPLQTASRSSYQSSSVKGVLKNLQNFTGHFIKDSLKLYLKETPTQVFSSKVCGIFKNSYFEEHLQTTASALPRIYKT